MFARLRKAMEEREQGFTLIELLVVVIIIGILAAIAIPVFLSQRSKAYNAGAKADLRNAATSEEAFLTDSNTYSVALTDLVAAGFKSTSGVTMYAVINAGQGFCLAANNTKANPGSWYTYDNANGGLQSGVYTSEADAQAGCGTVTGSSTAGLATATWTKVY